MVGVRTSSGCDTCRKRKKKCGEERPSCLRCVEGGWKCPGYSANWRFINETNRVSEYYAQQRDTYKDVDLGANGAIMLLPKIDRSGLTGSPWSPLNTCNPLACTLVHVMNRRPDQKLVPLRTIGSFFDRIPARLGTNAALDDVVSCLCAIYLDTSWENSRLVFSRYAKALKSLQVEVGDAARRLHAETLCATILLQFCELAINQNLEPWSNLVKGTVFLIEARGPEQFNDTFERGMLESQLSQIFSQAANRRELCFLSNDNWHNLLYNLHEESKQPAAGSMSLRTEMLMILSDLPTLRRDFEFVMQENAKSSPKQLEVQKSLLQSRISELYGEFEAFYSHEISGLASLHHSADSSTSALPVFGRRDTTEYLKYPDLLSAVVDCVSQASLLAIENMIFSLAIRGRDAKVDGGEGRSNQSAEYARMLVSPSHKQVRRRRINLALAFVRKKSLLAAKPLEFGLRGIRYGCVGYDSVDCVAEQSKWMEKQPGMA